MEEQDGLASGRGAFAAAVAGACFAAGGVLIVGAATVHEQVDAGASHQRHQASVSMRAQGTGLGSSRAHAPGTGPGWIPSGRVPTQRVDESSIGKDSKQQYGDASRPSQSPHESISARSDGAGLGSSRAHAPGKGPGWTPSGGKTSPDSGEITTGTDARSRVGIGPGVESDGGRWGSVAAQGAQ